MIENGRKYEVLVNSITPLSKQDAEFLVDSAIATENPENLYQAAKKLQHDIKKLNLTSSSEETYLFDGIRRLSLAISVLDSPYHMYWFARNIEGADIKVLQEGIISSKDLEPVCLFARDIPGANIAVLQDIVLSSKKLCYVYWFAKDVKGADISSLQKKVIDSQEAKYLYEFARYVRGADIKVLQQAIEKTGNPEYAYYFAKYVRGADIPSLQRVVIASKDFHYARRFAQDINGYRTTYIKHRIANSFLFNKLKQKERD